MNNHKPIQLSQSLMKAATVTASCAHRTVDEQIEYWVKLGRIVDGAFKPLDMVRLQAGLVNIKLVSAPDTSIDSDKVFARLEANRESGELAQSITGSTVRYEASKNHSGLLDQVAPNGDVITGTFHDGIFHPTAN